MANSNDLNRFVELLDTLINFLIEKKNSCSQFEEDQLIQDPVMQHDWFLHLKEKEQFMTWLRCCLACKKNLPETDVTSRNLTIFLVSKAE
jgi:hypothetical protein